MIEYGGSDFHDFHLNAVNVTTGETLWSMGNATTSAALRNGVLFVGVTTPSSPNVMHLYAFDGVTGQLQWSAPSQRYEYVTSIVAPHGTSFVVVLTQNGVHGVNGSNGTLVWTYSNIMTFDPQLLGLFNGTLSLRSLSTLYGLDIHNGTALWQCDIRSIAITMIPTSAIGVVAYPWNRFKVDAIDVSTGIKTEWATVNISDANQGWVSYDAANKMVVVQCDSNLNSSLLIFDSTLGTLVATVRDFTSPNYWYFGGCFAGQCISYEFNIDTMTLMAGNYMTGSLVWNATMPMNPINSWTYMRPNLIIIAFVGAAVVVGIDPTSGKYWTQPFGMYEAYLLQQRGSSQVLVGSCGALVLANV